MMLKNYNSESKKYIKQSKILFIAAVSVTSFDNNSWSSTTSISYIKWQKGKPLLILENNIFKLNKTTATTKYWIPSESKWLQHSVFFKYLSTDTSYNVELFFKDAPWNSLQNWLEEIALTYFDDYFIRLIMKHCLMVKCPIIAKDRKIKILRVIKK
jgi:hypothetical protein